MNRGELRIGNFVRTREFGVCRILNVYGIGEVDLMSENGKEIDGPISIDLIDGIPFSHELGVCFGFEPQYDTVCNDWDWYVWVGLKYHLRLSNFYTNSSRPWSLHIDNSDMDTVGCGEFQYLHQLQNLVHSITDEELEPQSDLISAILKREQRLPMMDAYNEALKKAYEHTDEDSNDPWWKDFAQIVEWDGAEDYQMFCDLCRPEYIDYFAASIDLSMLIEDEDQFRTIWEANEEFYSYGYKLTYDGDYLDNLYKCNIMSFVMYAICSQEDEPYMWLSKCLE